MNVPPISGPSPSPRERARLSTPTATEASAETASPRLTFADMFERMKTHLAAAADLPKRIPVSHRIPVVTLTAGLTSGALIGCLAGGPVGAAVGAAVGLVAGATGAALMRGHGWSKPAENADGNATRISPTERLYENVRARIKSAGADVTLEPIHDSPLRAPEMQARVDRITDAPRRDGCQVRLLPDGVQAFDIRYRMMAAAQRSINLQTYIFHDDETGRRVADLLRSKAREGVDVRVIVDGIGSQDTASRLFDEMRADGVEVKEFQPLGSLQRLNHRWHQKLLTVDDGAMVVGGMNVGSEYALYGTGHVDLSKGADASSASWMRDTDVVVTGPVVADGVRAFVANWALSGGQSMVTPRKAAAPPISIRDSGGMPFRRLRGITDPVVGVTTRHIVHRPYEERDTRIEDWYVTMLDGASSTAYISNAYFVPTDRVSDALVRAVRRGVDVRVLTNSPDTTDAAFPLPQWAARSSYPRLIEAGVRIYETQDTSKVLQHLHKKTAVFDGVASTVGSYNLDPRSASLNAENTLVIDGPDFGAQMNRMFASDLARSREIDLKTLRDGTMYDRLQQWFYGEVVRDHL